MALLGITLSLVIVFSLGAVGIWLLYNLFVNFQPGKSKISRDLKAMKTEITPHIKELVPIDKNDLELLSLNQSNKIIRRKMLTTAKGVFNSIYHEPMIAYSYKKYPFSKENAILYATTANHEFVYRIKKNKIQVTVNNQFIGTLKDDGGLYHPKSQKAYAHINRKANTPLLPVHVGQREVASLVNPALTNKVNPRAFELITPMKKEEETVLLSLSILELVNQSIKK